jgi:outer membrane immunogenic protein
MMLAAPGAREGMKGRPMRWQYCALILLGLASPAAAADLDSTFLRGSETVGPGTFTRWSGFYIGGEVGYGNANADFGQATAPGIAYSLRNTTLEASFAPSQWHMLGTANVSTPTYGGFIGYNTQWQDLILGVEANINRAGFNLKAPNNPIGRTTGADSGGNAYTVAFDASGFVDTMEFATVRGRAGYVVGNFLPYGFFGLALGVANVAVTSTATIEEFTSGSALVCTAIAPCGFLAPVVSSFARNNEVLYGFTVGGGVDVALTANVFARLELEFDQFNPQPNILLTVATARVGAGFKF